jgi:acyl-CoA synthetase (AMP-forming)/AMP-acid ligase II
MTELANWVAGASSEQDGISEGLVGRPWGGQAALMDGAGTVRMEGEGELLVRSPSVMSGYLNRPDLTDLVLIDGWLHTGDTARIDGGGAITLTGRIKDEINRAGIKIHPAEIESLLHAHPSILEACVLAIPDLASGEVVAAAVCPRPGAVVAAEELQRWCAARIRREAVPERWAVVDAMPRNRRGKVDRDTLRMIMTQSPR